MKKIMKYIKRVSLFILFIIAISINIRNVYAYQIENIVMPKEDLNLETNLMQKFPTFIYRKQTAAYISEINTYNNTTTQDGWIYDTTAAEPSNTKNEITTSHSNANSFTRVYEYLHRSINSQYSTTSDTGYSTARYYLTGSLKPTDSASVVNLNKSFVYNIPSETTGYSGLYKANNLMSWNNIINSGDIVIFNENRYRWAVKDGVYISDNYIDSATASEIWTKFKGANSEGELTIYNSSVTRTASSNGGSYYKNMDTAYKFWETTVLNTGTNWASSSTTTGNPATHSIINYYDNTFIIPVGNAKKVYVRHVDVTGLQSIKPELVNDNARLIQDIVNGQAFEVNQNKFIGYRDAAQRYGSFAKDGSNSYSTLNYSEKYENPASDNKLLVGNVHYNNSSDYVSQKNGSKVTLNFFKAGATKTSMEENILANYKCVGIAVGAGDSVDNAINAKKTIANNGNSTAYSVDDQMGDYVVIDFYYEAAKNPAKVYVRHIDLSSKNGEVTYQNVYNAIDAGQVLDGYRIAEVVDTTYTKHAITPTGPNITGKYQELYTRQSFQVLKIRPDDAENRYCIGSNITGHNISLQQAQNLMNSKLYNKEYDNLYYRQTNEIGNNNYQYIIIDFYYTDKNTGVAINREPKGRLSFYTLEDQEGLSGASSSLGTINNTSKSTSDTASIIDVIPSGESMTTSIDNAPAYMLGGIKIVPCTISKNYTFTYTIRQPYTVNYLYWTTYCPTCTTTHVGKLENGDEGYVCGKWLSEDCPGVMEPISSESDEGFMCPLCQYFADVSQSHKRAVQCEGILDAPSSTYIQAGHYIDKSFSYTIPVTYNYYKVANMRLYSISKMELLDNYNNKGLPLFDGELHTIYPTKKYVGIFNEKSGQFIQSTNMQGWPSIDNDQILVEYTTKTLDTLRFEYNNQSGNISVGTATEHVRNTASDVLHKITDNKAAAEFAYIDVEENIEQDGEDSYTTGTVAKKYTVGEHVLIKLYVRNDQILFTNDINGTKEVILGDGTDYITWPAKNLTGLVWSTEKSMARGIDLYKFANSEYSSDELEALTKVETKYPASIRTSSTDLYGSKYLPKTQKTTKDYFESVPLKIPEDRLNGKRYSFGKLYYNIISNNTNLNFDTKGKDGNDIVDKCNDENKKNESYCHNWKHVDGTKSFNDTEMHNTSGKEDAQTTLINNTNLGTIIWEYGKNSNGADTKNYADVVNVFTPIGVATQIVTGGNNQVNHTTTNTNSNKTAQIQKNSRFEIKMWPTGNGQYSGITTTSKYLLQYYISFDFDVQDIKIYDAQNKNGRTLRISASAGTWIGPIYNVYGSSVLGGAAKISAFALADPYESNGSIVNQETNSYTVRAVAYNIPSSLVYDLVMNKLDRGTYIGDKENDYASSGQSHQDYYTQKDIDGHSQYIAEVTNTTENLNRVYDFKVTDLMDYDWKNIFRKSSTASTNVHTSKAYYSGIRKWNVYTTKANELLIRDSSEIGTEKKQILPLGPKKNTNTNYVKAPKLGYKFSFDLKTTGAMKTSTKKEVVITPEFYYISKDPDPSNSSKPRIEKDIKLYYKNSNSRYVSISNYNLYFVPDDGYRLTFEGTDAAYRFSNSNLSATTLKLGTATGLTLKNTMMEEADNMFVQIWYGEYKLPNSTIAVKKGGDINKDRLTGGYIGVKFKIEVKEYVGDTVKRVLDYNQKDSNASGNNTTQWDYEGYLGYNYDAKNGSDITQADNIVLPLEGMNWKLTQEDYELVKGTVILYDTDAKASDDYE